MPVSPRVPATAPAAETHRPAARYFFDVARDFRYLGAMASQRLLPIALAALILSSLAPVAQASSAARETVHRHHQKSSARSRHSRGHGHVARAHAGHRSGPDQTGEASWYGGRHEGRRTASGERFDPREMTAAHPTLPMNSRVKVTNLVNGRVVMVRINDRLPRSSHRIIDLSPRAAAEIGMRGQGIARVEIEQIASEESPPR